MKRWLKAGEILAFYILEPDGSRNLSHTVHIARGVHIVGGMTGECIGSFRTFAAATAAGFAASKELLDHGHEV